MSASKLAACIATYAILPFILSSADLRLATEILALGLFAFSFNIAFGHGGMLPFGHNAGLGVAAYVFGLLLYYKTGASFEVAALAGILSAVVVSFVIGLFSLHLRGSYFILATLSLCHLLYAVAEKSFGLTRGHDGFTLPPLDLSLPPFEQVHLDTALNLYLFTGAIVAACIALTWWFVRTPFGVALVLMRENSGRAAAIGYNVFWTRMIGFVFASALSGVAGVLFATHQSFVSPALLDVPLGGEVIFIAIVGGIRTLHGPFLGALFFVLLQDRLSLITTHWQLFFGIAFILIVMLAPKGLAPLMDKWLFPARKPTPKLPVPTSDVNKPQLSEAALLHSSLDAREL